MNQPTDIQTSQVQDWLNHHYGISGNLSLLVGDVDLNFKCDNKTNSYTVKLSVVADISVFDFETQLLQHVSETPSAQLALPLPVLNQQQQWITTIAPQGQQLLVMRVLTWVDGNLWSAYLPHNNQLLNQLGQQVAQLDQSLQGFEHPESRSSFDWDLAQCLWIKQHLDLFSVTQQECLQKFIQLFEANHADYQQLRQQVIHNDLNDNNVLVSASTSNHVAVSGFIDFGDAIHSQLINEVAIAAAYAIMDKADPLQAAAQVVSGFHQVMPLEDQELQHLYHLIGMRLAVSVTQSALAQLKEPDNAYKSISEQAAWNLLEQWQVIHPRFAYYQFRQATGLSPHPLAAELTRHLQQSSSSLQQLFPQHDEKTMVMPVDLSVGSFLLGAAAEYEDHAAQNFKVSQFQKQHPNCFLAGGYCEARSFYASDAFSTEGNYGKEYRTMHLGLDVWLPAQTAIHAPMAGRVVGLHNNDFKRDYGPTVILQHSYTTAGGVTDVFYTLYGHLSQATLDLLQLGDEVALGQLLAWTGESHENGGWSPHLHFQIIHDLLGREHDFPGACTPNHLPIMQSLCPDPKDLFGYHFESAQTTYSNDVLIQFRQQHLGKSMSLSYAEPIQMLRGDDVYLIDQFGQKYLDTCNNVAHVGHEHPAVVQAGQAQMAVLNTNSRYLHPAIIGFCEQLLATLPDELSVVHLVNSGSEANELALRMAKAYSGGQAVIALESGYHGNSNACIDISSYKFDGQGGQGAPTNTHVVPLPDAFRGRHRGADCGSKYVQYIDHAIAAIQQNKQQLSAFIAESIVSCGGQIELPQGYLQAAYQKVRAAGGLCIADEVQVGCGRIGSHFWAFESHNVVPDILTIGKPIGNGHPLAVVVCTRQVADRFANGMEYFNTFGGNPVSATIGHAVLSVIKQQHLQANAQVTGDYLKQQLKTLMKTHTIIKDVRGQGLFLGFELCDDQLLPLPQQASYLANRMREFGILISTDGPDHNVIKIKPPMTFNQAHADELLGRLAQILQENPMYY